jgi:hypothetical protein
MSQNKFAMITRCDSKAKKLAEVTHDILKDYAKQWGCDFIILGDEIKDTGDYEKNHYRILEAKKYLDTYERIVIIDSDVIIMPGTPNPFDVISPKYIGSIFEDVGSREVHRQMIIRDIQNKFGNVGWTDGYINTGFFIVSSQHKKIFDKIDGELWEGFGYDDALIGYNIRKYGFIVQELDHKWNFTAMFSEPWCNENRFNAHIIHYAGQANFPDDQSGRTSKTNSLADRLELIKNDMERIVQGLLTFKEAKPTPKQGYGSRVFEAKFGVQERDIILKVPNTDECLQKEIFNYTLGIPHTVQYLGMGEDEYLGKFLMFDKLNDLPDELTDALVLEIATKVLRVIRYCYKYGITWIPKLDHIKIDNNGDVKVIDFGDDDYNVTLFYGMKEGEAILMDGECDSEGNYTDRYNYPVSGYYAIIKYLCEKNGATLNSIFAMAERHIIETEYQELKDVHQPINMIGFETTLRTESEQGDAMYGKLVPANRKCIDRAKILKSNLPISAPKLPHGKTWLDIGCNVGWFCIEFADKFAMTGVDIDGEKIKFAQMISERQGADVKYYQDKIDLEGVDSMPNYDMISAFSMLHLQLVKDKDREAFWTLLEAICSKVDECFFFEFPPHSFGLAGVANLDEFYEKVELIGKFNSIENIGVSDAGRPMLKCLK